MIEIFTDGASSGNPGPGGYGVVLKYKQHRKELKAGYRRTTNNRMELLAVIKGLEAIKGEGKDILIYSDSQYVVKAINEGWIWGWQKKGFKGKKNEDLWRQFIPLYNKHNVKIKWLKGHAGHAENELCDQMAVASTQGGSLLIDEGYENAAQG
ncbi:MAG: ribonuclease HI [Cyclobacteriaceae bacterium]